MSSTKAGFFAQLPLLSSLSNEEIEEFSLTARPFRLGVGEHLCRQGEPAQQMFAISEGCVELSIRIAGSGMTRIGTLERGAVLGETALLGRGQRTATATALEPTSGYALDRKAFEVLRAAYRPSAAKVLRQLAGIISERIASMSKAGVVDLPPGELPDLSPYRTPARDLDIENLQRFPVLTEFHTQEIETLRNEFRKLEVPRGTVLFREGDPPGSCFITVRGAVEIYVYRDGRRVKLALQGPGTMFGEAGLFSGRPRSATGWAREDSILLEIDRPAFDRLFEEHSIVAFKFFDAAIVLLTELMRRALVRQAWFETERRGLLS